MGIEILPLGEFSTSHWEEVGDAMFEHLWQAEVDAVPEFTTSKITLICGLLLPNWDRLAVQNGSEVASVALERLQMIGLKLWDHRDAFEQMRDLAVDHFSAATGSPWLPRTGSRVSHRGLIAARWADTRGVTEVVFKPDWQSHGKAAPFKRNDKMLETMPQGLIATPGSGITENIVDKARKLGIRIKRIGA